MIPRYLYLYVFVYSAITIHCKTLTLTSLGIPYMHACCSPFQLSLSSSIPSFPQIAFLSALACFQHAPNTDMWLILSHLTFVHFIDLPGDRLELLLELCFLCLDLRDLLLECVYHVDYDFVTDQSYALFLDLYYMCLGFLCLWNDFCYSFLKQFCLSLTLPFQCLHSGEFFLQFLHILCSFACSVMAIVFFLYLRS
jgi:hypothetical protein